MGDGAPEGPTEARAVRAPAAETATATGVESPPAAAETPQGPKEAEAATPPDAAEQLKTEKSTEAARRISVLHTENGSARIEAVGGSEREQRNEDSSVPSKADGNVNGKGHPAEEEALLKKVEPPQVEKLDFWKLSMGEKTSYIRNNITVEPMLAMYIIPSILASLATQNLNLEKACRVNLGYSDEICDALTRRETANYTFEESEVQRLTASMAGWKTFIQSSLPGMLILFVGSWTDRHGCRKPCMLLPILGEFLTSIGLIVCTYFYYELPIEAATFCEAVFPAMTGGWFVMFMAVFTYISDVTTEVDRTFRIGVVNVFFSLGIPIGMALSGVTFRLIGFYGVFGLSSCMYLYSFWWGWSQIKEEPKKWSGDGPEPEGLTGFLRDFFDVRYLLETFKTSFKKGPNKRQLRVLLLMLTVMLVIGPMHGENTVVYLYVRRKFNWDELDFSIFSTYCVVVNLIGTMLSVGLFSALLKYDDSVIGMMSCASKILAGFVYAFATTVEIVCIAPLIDMMNGTSFIAMRAIASKLVPSEELGKLNSLFGACEALMPVICGPLYSKVYQATMDTLPGAFFLVGGVITGPAFCIFGWYYYEVTKERRKTALKEIKGP